MAPCKPIFFCIKQFCLSLFIFLHFEFWVFCIFACRFACFHLHLCCEFLILVKVFFKMFSCLFFAFAPCPMFCLHALLLCCCTLLFCLDACYHALLFIVTPCCLLHLVVHHCTLLLVVMPCYLPSCCAGHLFFFRYLLPPPHCCFVVLFFISISTPSPLSCTCGRAWNNNNKFHPIN